MVQSKGNLFGMFEDWLPNLPALVKNDLVRSLSVGVGMLPSTSGWKSDGFKALI